MKLNPALDQSALAQAFAKDQRLQIGDFLDRPDALRLAAEFENINWRLVLNEGMQHFDIAPHQLEAMTPEQMSALHRAALLRGETEFQYIYKNYPVSDVAEGSGLTSPVLEETLEFMNSADVLQLLNGVTGCSADYCDVQATRYESGHFLTTHDDDVDGKNRQFAYVLSLSQDWKAGWGGALQFIKDRRTDAVSKSFVPRFNSLSIFAVPTPHRVSRVEPHARSPRLSLTGWFRTRT